GVVGLADASEPGGAAAQDGRGDGDTLDIVDGGGRAVEAGVGGEWRLQARLALLALQALQQRRLLAADVGAGTVVHVAFKVPAVHVVLANQPGLVGLVDGRLQALALAHELTAHVDVADVRAHGVAGDEAALDEEVRLVPHDLAVLAGAGL